MGAGMVRLLGVLCALIGISGAALAADLPPRPAPAPYIPAVVPVYNWTGFYIGGNLGAAWTQGNVSDSFGTVGATHNRPYSRAVAKSVPTISSTGSSLASKQISTGWQMTAIQPIQCPFQVATVVSCRRITDG